MHSSAHENIKTFASQTNEMASNNSWAIVSIRCGIYHLAGIKVDQLIVTQQDYILPKWPYFVLQNPW